MEKAESIFLRLETRQGYPFSPLALNIVSHVLARTIKEGNEINRIKTGKEQVKLSMSADDIMLHMGKPKCSVKKLLEQIRHLSKVARLKIKQGSI